MTGFMFFSLRASIPQNKLPTLWANANWDFAPSVVIKYLSRMSTATLLILCTVPDRETALRLADHLVDQGLAACVNITQSVTSVYRWQDQRETAEEILLLIKSTPQRYRALETAILALHPYELPEIIAVPVTQGLTGYLDWVEQCTKTTF
jgi:periplasmic divalent cation tolerance protein